VAAKVEYGGQPLRTKASEKGNKHVDSFIRLDFKEQIGRSSRTRTRPSYGQIKHLFSHEMYPGGPTHVVVEAEWFDDKGFNEVSKLPMVQKSDRLLFDGSRLAFLKECYPRPLAFWPNDPLRLLAADDERRTFFQVIDRNETAV
jgi:hypothetical protein